MIKVYTRSGRAVVEWAWQPSRNFAFIIGWYVWLWEAPREYEADEYTRMFRMANHFNSNPDAS